MNLPYKGQSGNRLIRKLKHIVENNTPPEVKTCFTYNTQKLASRFHTKDITRKEHRHGLVYKVTCGHDGCGEFYIGETGRRLQERIRDHNARDKSSSLCKHALETGHPPVNIEQFLVLNDGLNNYKKRKLSEALFIKEQKPTLNEQGQSIPLTLLN